MSIPAKKLSYPYISSDPKISSGAPIIDGTRITVRTIAGYYQMGMDADEILATLTHLTPAQLRSALAYYFDYQKEIDKDLEENSDDSYWERQVKQHPKEGVPPSEQRQAALG